MNKLAQCALLTLAAGGLYVGLRSLPDVECGFLHYDPPVVDADGIQFCGTDQPVFIEVRELKYPVKCKLRMGSDAVVGEPVQVTLEFETDSGQTITPVELAITHTELLHVLVVDPSREDYHHVHPTPEGNSGQWTFTFTPNRPGPYSVFTEFVPARTQQVVLSEASIPVTAADAIPAGEPVALPDGWTAELVLDPQQLKLNQEARLQLKISRADGQPAVLEPVMGAWAHLVAFDESLSGFAHLHPKYTGLEKDDTPQMEFVFSTHRPGDYRIWAQVKVDGQERFIPFETAVN